MKDEASAYVGGNLGALNKGKIQPMQNEENSYNVRWNDKG